MRIAIRTVLIMGIILALVSYSLLIAYAIDSSANDRQYIDSQITSILARRDELASFNQQLEVEKSKLSSELIVANEQQKLAATAAELEKAQLSKSQLAAQQALLKQQQDALNQAQATTQTVQKVPVTIVKKPTTVKKVTTRAS